jgi:hypothetical protein
MEHSKTLKALVVFGFFSMALMFVGSVLCIGGCIFNPEIQDTGRNTLVGQIGFFMVCVGALGALLTRICLPDDEDEEDEEESTENKKDSK